MDKEMRLAVNFYETDNITEIDRLQRLDTWMLQDIKRAENIIKECKQYRLELAKRMQELTTMNYHYKVILERKKDYNNKVHFYLSIRKVYEDNSEELISKEHYTGTKRSEAIKAYKQITKQNPQWEHVMSIEKGRWEK